MRWKVLLAICLVALQAALPVVQAGETEQPFTLGYLSSHGTGLATGDHAKDWRPAVQPLLRFDGKRWVNVEGMLKLADEEREKAFEPTAAGQRRRVRKVPDFPLRKAEKLARTAPNEWLNWYAVEDSTPFDISGAWRHWESCEPTWVLAADGSKLNRRTGHYVSTNANAVMPFRKIPDDQTTALREYAAKQFEAMDAKTLKSDAYKGGVEMYKERAEILRSNGDETFIYRELPQTVAQLRKFPLRWFTTYCAESASQATTVCQLVAKRRFDSSDAPKHAQPPLLYRGFVRQRSGEEPELLFANATLQIRIDWDGSVEESDGDLAALVQAGNKLWIWKNFYLLEGNSHCAIPVEKQSADRSKWVCATSSC